MDRKRDLSQTYLVVDHQRAEARCAHDVNRLDDLSAVVRIHRRQQAARLDAMFDDSRRQRRSLGAMREPVCLLLRQPFDRVPSRCRLRLEFLHERLRELRVSVSPRTVKMRALTLRPIRRTVRHVVLGILLPTERAQRSPFFLVPSSRGSEVVR